MKTIIEEMEKKEKIENFKVEFKNSKKLKSFLQSAMNTATCLTSYIPKITDELIIVINQYQKIIKEKINLKDNRERFDTFKSLRQFAYGLVDYDPSIKANKIGSFEMVVERSIHSALMSVNKFGSIQVVDGNGDASPLYLNTDRLGIGGQPTNPLSVTGAVDVSSSLAIGDSTITTSGGDTPQLQTHKTNNNNAKTAVNTLTNYLITGKRT